MPINSFKKVKLDELAVSKFQDNCQTSFEALTKVPLLDGVLLQNVKLISGKTNEVNHKLDRNPLGWIITRQRRDSSVWDLQDENKSPSKTVSLACSVDVIIDIWVF